MKHRKSDGFINRLKWRLKWVSATLLVAVMLPAVYSCGKKGPPVPPNRPPLPEATLLEAAAVGDEVSLRWRIEGQSAAVAGYTVLRASYPLSGPACPTCHQTFHQIEKLPRPRGAREMTFTEQVPAGLHYTYKVQPYDSNGAKGPASNPAEVDVP